MIDIITHIPDLDAFRAECKAKAEEGNKFFSIDEDVITYNVAKIPVVYSDDLIQSVCLVRLITDEEIEEFTSLESCDRIGVCENNEYIFETGGEVIYNAVYDQSPVIFEIDGEQHTHTPPQMIGVFA